MKFTLLFIFTVGHAIAQDPTPPVNQQPDRAFLATQPPDFVVKTFTDAMDAAERAVEAAKTPLQKLRLELKRNEPTEETYTVVRDKLQIIAAYMAVCDGALSSMEFILPRLDGLTDADHKRYIDFYRASLKKQEAALNFVEAGLPDVLAARKILRSRPPAAPKKKGVMNKLPDPLRGKGVFCFLIFSIPKNFANINATKFLNII